MNKYNKKGFSLIELLVVVAILAILVTIALSMVTSNRDKATDAKTKSDLNRLKIAFEDYYGDHNCYPPAEWFDDASDCGSDVLKPYLNSLACNRKTDLPYAYVTDSTGCSWFKLYGTLLVDSDNDALTNSTVVDSIPYNYGVSSSNTSLVDAPSPLPANHYYYYCSAVGNCTSFNASTHICNPYYVDNPNCDGGTSPCQSVGSCIQF
ncbi:MAG: type II secretion system protein [Candidatus Moraniibacteriota bacterium]|nr:MAG: type II secretion system protein [Candidatus Moranbacteria bacterium]